MADGNITVEVSTQAAQAELERLRVENAALKSDLQYARDGLTKGRTRMREDNERLAREAYTWSKAAEAYAAEAERLRAVLAKIEAGEYLHLPTMVRDALGPNVGGEARLAAHRPPHTTTATPQGVASTDQLGLVPKRKDK